MKIMKRLLLCTMLMSLSVAMMGQKKLTAAQQQQIVAKINKATAALNELQCDFTQTKSMKMLSKKMQSSGVMYYKKSNKLRWQYNSTYTYTFILNGDKVRIISAKSSKKINVKDNKMFRHVSNIMIDTMTGEGLKSSADFNVEMYQRDKTYYAKLYPKKKELKQIYRVIEIHFNTALTMVSSVMMEEKTGDVTVVKLSNVKTNNHISEKIFSTE